MMYNIKTGHNNVTQRHNAEIAILVSSLHKIKELGLQFVFTNGHAYVEESEHFDDLADLDKIDWDLLRSRNFQRDPEDPGKLVRYQAEALVHRKVPVDALMGIACYDVTVKRQIQVEVDRRQLAIDVKTLPEWYFKL